MLTTRFYDEGYQDGFAHGGLHGLFEGRQLGQEKAWELWEEIGFYEGFARLWLAKLGAERGDVCGSRKVAKALAHVRSLLALIESFPTTNPTPVPDRPLDIDSDDEEAQAAAEKMLADARAAAPDLAGLLQSIRARYRLLCTSVGARPRLVAAARDGTDGSTSASAGVVEGIEGPMKGVDTRQLKF